MSRKDEILARMLELDSDIKSKREEYQALVPETKELENTRDQLDKMLDEIRRQFNEVDKKWRDNKGNLDLLTRQGQACKFEKDQLQRELNRLLDAESINARYLEQVEAFRQRCLDAAWRGENRTDGFGAYPHQIEGAIHLAISGQAILGDKRGLGKSLTSLIYCDFSDAKRVILVCPSDTMGNYIREIQLWTPHRSPIQIGKMPKGVRDVTLNVLKHQAEYTVVVNFEAWRRDPQLLEDLVALRADTIIIDEAHKMKNVHSLTYKGIKQIRFGLNKCDCGDPDVHLKPKHDIVAVCDSCGKEGTLPEFCSIDKVLPMTGTPILNRPQEIFPLLHLIDCENFKLESEFLRDFCLKYGDHWGWRSGGEKRLIEKIGPRFLARDPKSTGVIIPPSTTIVHTVTKEEFEQDYRKQFEAYEQCREYAQLILDPDNAVVMSMPAKITVLLRLRQVLTWPAAIELKVEDPKTKEILFHKNLDVYESAKLDKAEELIREIIEEGERVVLFSQFKAPLHILQERLGLDAIVYDGSTPDYLKQEIQLDFDPKTAPDKPRWKVALCNYKAAGEGLNMNSASQMILLDREWNPGKEDQAKGRIDRIGQTRDSTIHVLSVERSVDTWLDALIQEKREIIGGFESQQQVFQSAYDALRDGEM